MTSAEGGDHRRHPRERLGVVQIDQSDGDLADAHLGELAEPADLVADGARVHAGHPMGRVGTAGTVPVHQRVEISAVPPDEHGRQVRQRDDTTRGGAVPAQHLSLARDGGQAAEHVRRVGVSRGQREWSSLASAAEHDRHPILQWSGVPRQVR